MTAAQLETETVPLASLAQFPGNPRRGDVGLIMLSLRKRGQYKPLIISKDNVILAGNHTAQAMAELGYEHAAVVRLPLLADSPEAAELVLVDNRASDMGSYDTQNLAELLSSLPDLSVSGTGYVPEDLTALMESLGISGAGGTDLLDPVPPEEFNEYDDTITIQYGCPSCGYEWSGKPRPNAGVHGADVLNDA